VIENNSYDYVYSIVEQLLQTYERSNIYFLYVLLDTNIYYLV